MSAHTPTPWRCTYGGTPLRAKRIAFKDESIANCVGPQSMSNAAHIVRCVNAHDELVAALRLVRPEIAKLKGDALRQIDAALAKLEAS